MSEPNRLPDTLPDAPPRAAPWVIPDYLYDIVVEDPEIAGELLDLFFQTAAGIIEELTVGIRQHDAKLVCRLSHTLKGSTLQLGANDMAALAEAIETSAGQGDLNGMWESIACLKSMLELLYPEIQNSITGSVANLITGRG